jgi:hypothetical protein
MLVDQRSKIDISKRREKESTAFRQPAPKKWFRVSEAAYIYSLSRTRLFLVFDSAGGPVETKLVIQPGNTRGIRLVNKASLEAYLEGFDSEGRVKR